MNSLAFAILASTLLAGVSASNNIHAHHLNLHAKRDAAVAWEPTPSANTTCGCTTYTTTWYGEATLVQDQPTYTTNTSENASPTTTSVWTSTSSSSSSSSSSEAVSATAGNWAASSSAWPSASSWGGSSGSGSSSSGSSGSGSSGSGSSSSGSSWGGSSGSGTISTNGNQWAMTYTGYTSSGGCKQAPEVEADIASIAAKGFTTVRLYAPDCSTLQNVGSSCAAHGLKMVLGVYISSTGIGSDTDAQIAEITSWGQGQWDLVEMVVFGNEAIFNGYVSSDELVSAIASAKSSLQSAGYTGPVTTTEPLNIIQEYADQICPVVDVIAANMHPFFNPETTAETAGTFVASSLESLAACCNNEKDAYNLETGWPSQGEADGAAVPGIQNQKTAITNIINSAGSKCALFSFENDYWKEPGPLDVEQYWGCADLFSG